MTDPLEFGDLLRIARAVHTDTVTVCRILADATDTPQARQVRALALEALSRAIPSRRVRVVPQGAVR